MKTLLTLIAFLSVSLCGYAQQGTLTGKVKDKLSGEPIIGATVAVVGTSTGASTDFNGDYSIPLNAGTYRVTISYVSYKSQTQENVSIKAGQNTTLDVNLETSATELNAVTITGARQTNTEVAMIQEMKNSEVVVSGISSEQITKSLDRDAAETVRRIPGVTIMDSRFIMVRGLSERYNTVMLNDALTPSTETDVKAFSFDILPTSVIDRILINKSGSPELPGEFAGGVIKIYTKNVANENSTTLGISTGFRQGTTFNTFKQYQGSKTDFLGFDNGTRSLPNSFPENIGTTGGISSEVRQLKNTWVPENTTASPDLRLQLGLTRRLNLRNIQLSNISALTYSNTRTSIDKFERYNYQAYDPATKQSQLDFHYTDFQSRSYLINNFTRISMQANKMNAL